jgi:hypothetical protein
MLSRIRRRLPASGQAPWIILGSLLIALLVSPFAIAAGEGRPVNGGARNPTADPSQSYTRETEIIANTSTYGTRQSNKSDNGGGAIYGCRSRAGGSPAGNEPCIRASNLADGRAFEFSTGGAEVGRIESANTNAAPFTTNATGVATGLNADRVDGKNADDLTKDATTAATTAATKAATDAAQAQSRFAFVAADGTLGATRGATASTRTAAGTYRVTFSGDVSKCAPQATIASTAQGAQATTGAQVVDASTVEVVTRAVAPVTGANPVAVGDAVDRPVSLTLTC